jgi:glycosyltransferase involved in cell wall biosynthesis
MNKLNEMKVLAVLGYGGFFGGERANLKVIKMLNDCGANVECLVLADGGEAFQSTIKTEGFVCHPAKFGPSYFGLSGDPVHYFKNLFGMLRVSIKLYSVAKKFKPDKIYVPNYIQFLYVWPSLFFVKSDVVFRIGDPPENTTLHKCLWSKIISPRVKNFVANSQYTLRCLFNTGVHESKGQVINNCLTRDVEALPSKDVLAEKYIVYAGQINEQKGVDIAVKWAIILCNKYEDVYFKFLGPFDETSEYSKSIIDNIRNSNLSDRIIFLGYEKDILTHFATSYLHICPSVQEESSANVVIEAKCCSVPSIVFPRGGLPELINHKVDGYICESADVDCLVEGLEYFIENQDFQKKACVEAGKSFLSFSEDSIKNKWVRLFTV